MDKVEGGFFSLTVMIHILAIDCSERGYLLWARAEEFLAEDVHVDGFPHNGIHDRRALFLQKGLPVRVLRARGRGVDVFHEFGMRGREIHEVERRGGGGGCGGLEGLLGPFPCEGSQVLVALGDLLRGLRKRVRE